MNIFQRYKSPTPKYFRRLRNAGLMLAAAGGALTAAPSPELAAIGGYLIVAGAVATAVAQAAVADRK